MSTTYRVVKGDTYVTISRRAYGYESPAPLIARSNPGLLEPLPVGALVIIPDLVDTPLDLPHSAPGQPDELVITINGRRFRFWEGVTVRRAVDSVDTLELTAPFNPDDPEFRQNFKPFSYPRVRASVGGAPVFTGTLTTVRPVQSAAGLAVAAGAYSLPGVLADCCLPASVYAEGTGSEFENVDLRRIASTLLAPFGLKAVFEADPGKTFESVAIKPTEPVLPWLAKLSKQRGLVVSSSAAGDVVFWQSALQGNPVAVFQAGVAGPVVSVTPTFETQSYYSHVTGIEPNSVGLDGGQHTERNSRLSGVLRPFTFQASDAAGVDLQTATRAKLGRMFGDAVSYSVELDTWRDYAGDLWRPNSTVILTAPGAMVYEPYEFLIREVEFRRNANDATATLNLVIPAAYRGEVPERMPWE